MSGGFQLRVWAPGAGVGVATLEGKGLGLAALPGGRVAVAAWYTKLVDV